MNVGALRTGVLAMVDERGMVTTPRGGAVGWRIHAGNRWIDPATDTTVRHSRAGAAPVAQTSVRVPGGDAVQRVYAVGSHGGVVVIDVENASAEAIAVAFTAAGGSLVLPRKPGATEPDGTVVFPVPHRTAVRVALSDEAELDPRGLEDAATVARGWGRVLDRGMRTELPEPSQTRVDAARADALLAPPSAQAFVDLETWGFDDEASAMWELLDTRARRAARRHAGMDGGTLGALHKMLVLENGRTVEVLPDFPAEWLGQSLALHGAPLRRGLVSFAVRWHGARPALLWDAPPGSVIRAPALDPAWSSSEAAGETLLREPEARSRA
jgi:hypothetical protein